jgi:hypothetical protein
MLGIWSRCCPLNGVLLKISGSVKSQEAGRKS